MKARRSFGPDVECKHPWPDDCFVQCGGDGIVLPGGTMESVLKKGDLEPVIDGYQGKLPGAYRTAFFEAFPRTPNLFLRGEGKTVLEAEDSCWRQFKLVLACQKHELYRTPGYTNGMATCKFCGMTGTFFEPSTNCKSCGKPTSYYRDSSRDDWYCQECLDADKVKDQPCDICGKREPPTVRMEPEWSKRLGTGSGYKEFMHPECDGKGEES